MARRSKPNRDKEKLSRPPAAADVPASVNPAPAIPAWRRHAVPLLVLWGMALLAYANSFRDGLVFDNYFVIAQDSRVRQATAENARLILNQSYWYKTTASYSNAVLRKLTSCHPSMYLYGVSPSV